MDSSPAEPAVELALHQAVAAAVAVRLEGQVAVHQEAVQAVALAVPDP
jgi:hypothetical protein